MKKRTTNKRKRRIERNDDDDDNDEKNPKKMKLVKNKELNYQDKFNQSIQMFEKEGFDSTNYIKSLFLYWLGNYSIFLKRFDDNQSFKRIKNDENKKIELLSYEKFCWEVEKDIKELDIVFTKEIDLKRGKTIREKICSLIDYLYNMDQNNESIGEYLYLYRGMCYENTQNREKCIEVINEGVGIIENKLLLSKLYSNRGLMFYRNKKLLRGLVDCNKSIELNPKQSSSYLNKGCCLHELGDFPGAIQSYSKAIEVDPTELLAYNNIGRAYVELKDFSKAIEYHNKAIELDPENPDFYRDKAFCLDEMDKVKEAIKCLTKAIILRPTCGVNFSLLAFLYQKNCKLQKAIYCYTKAINYMNNDNLIRNELISWRNLSYSLLKRKITGFDFDLFDYFDDYNALNLIF